jgi:hypothetical protein
MESKIAQDSLKKDVIERVLLQYKEISKDILDSTKKSETLQKFVIIIIF